MAGCRRRRRVPIERYVNSFEIAQERVGPNQYLGVINVSYVAAEVRSAVVARASPSSRRRSDPILVVPLDLMHGEPDAWDETSPWRAAWIRRHRLRHGDRLALPLGDLADIAAASPGPIVAGDPAVLEALAHPLRGLEPWSWSRTRPDPASSVRWQISDRLTPQRRRLAAVLSKRWRWRRMQQATAEAGGRRGGRRDRGRLEAAHRGAGDSR